MAEPTLTRFPVLHVHPQLPALRKPSTLPEIFVRALVSDDPPVPNGDELDLNVVLDLDLYVEVIEGKERGCFILPDTYILVLAVWSPLPVPCRPMAIAQLDRFMGISRDIPTAPLWAAEVRGSKENPLRFLRTAHWVRKQVEDALSPFTTTLSPDTLHVWSSLIGKINSLILFFERSRLSRYLQANPSPRPRPRPRPVYHRQRLSVDIHPVSEGAGLLHQQLEDVPEDLVGEPGIGTPEL